MNTKKLLLAAKPRGVEMNLFYFDPRIIDWEDYFMNIHIPGIFKHALK
jgi:fatty acyl-CoA reductase